MRTFLNVQILTGAGFVIGAGTGIGALLGALGGRLVRRSDPGR